MAGSKLAMHRWTTDVAAGLSIGQTCDAAMVPFSCLEPQGPVPPEGDTTRIKMQMEVPSPQKTLGDGGASTKSAPLKIVDAGGGGGGVDVDKDCSYIHNFS